LALLVMFTAAFITPSFAQINWSNRSPAGITDAVWCVTYANGTFAAVTDQGNLLTSTDGLAWSSQAIDSGVWLISIAYGNGNWVAVGAGGAILVSSDLKTWVSATSATPNKLNGVLFGNGVFVAVGDSATIITSTNGLNWTVQSIPANFGVTGFLHGISLVSDPSYSNSQFLISGALAGNGTGATDTGVIIEMASTPTAGTQNYPMLRFDGGGDLAGYPYNGNVGNLEAVISEPNSTVAVGWEGTILTFNLLATGQDQLSSVPNVVYRGLTFGNGFWVAAGEQGTILSSTDGINWKQRFSGDSPSTVSTATLLSAAYSPTLQRFVIAGTGGTILVSNSAPTVFGNVSTRGYVSSTQTFIGGFVIEGSAPRTVLIRADGPVLSAFSVPSPLPDPVLTVYDNKGNVVATNTGWSTTTNPTTISTAALEVGAFALPNPGLDSALLLTLPPGAYTAQITSAKGNAGIALFEAYTD